ncbi:terminase small subunit [Vreelandella populi]|uniref:terminase small subunit n=1 Tax=Vreelandella populi TaxID=2498858 RepID=UPI000F8E0D00|nr:terminase small subunit [Halomonas populi]RUR51409.1 DNA packaging protein [Halomonas populi]
MTSVELINVCQLALLNWHAAGLPGSLNKRALSELLEVSERTLTDWQQKGMPVAVSAGRGASNEYSPAEVMAWLLVRANDTSRESAKDRLDRLRGDQLEREILKEDGVLVMPDDLDVEYGALVEAARAELLFNMPDALAAELTAIHGEEVDVSVIRRHIEDALTTLSHYDDSSQPEPSDEESTEA